MLMPAGSATGGVIIWDTQEGGRRTADLRNNGHEYGIPVCHLAAYPTGDYFVSADTTVMKVRFGVGLKESTYLAYEVELSECGKYTRLRNYSSHFKIAMTGTVEFYPDGQSYRHIIFSLFGCLVWRHTTTAGVWSCTLD